MDEVDGCDAVINLAGEHIFAHRWSTLQKTKIRNSRIFSTWNVVHAIAAAEQKPKVLLTTSAIGYYGNIPEGELDETSPPSDDFLAKLTADWDSAALEAESHGVRVALIRVGVVLSTEGGALKQMLPPFKMGLGGRVGSGKHWVSWIHLDDLVAIYLRALDDHKLNGPINATGPVPVTNSQFSKELAGALHRPCCLPMPESVLRMALGEVADVVIGGQRVIPRKLRRAHFEFKYPTCGDAMRSLFV